MRTQITKLAGAPLDMPLPRGRIAKGALVFDDGCAFLQLRNLEKPVVWKIDLGRTRTTKAADLGASFHPGGSRHSVLFTDGPAMPATPGEMAAERTDEYGYDLDRHR